MLQTCTAFERSDDSACPLMACPCIPSSQLPNEGLLPLLTPLPDLQDRSDRTAEASSSGRATDAADTFAAAASQPLAQTLHDVSLPAVCCPVITQPAAACNHKSAGRAALGMTCSLPHSLGSPWGASRLGPHPVSPLTPSTSAAWRPSQGMSSPCRSPSSAWRSRAGSRSRSR